MYLYKYSIQYLNFLLCFSLICSVSDTANILGIFPIPLKSFFYYNEAIMKSLHAVGHNIVFINPFSKEKQSTENYTLIDSKFDNVVYVGQTSVDDFSKMSTRKFAKLMIDLEEKYCDAVMQLQAIKEGLAGKKRYDVMFIGMIQMYECYLSMAEQLEIPVIGTINYRSWMSERTIGNPFNPAIVPLVWSSHGKFMTFPQRLINSWNIIMNDLLYTFVVSPKLDRFNRKHFPNLKSTRLKRPSLVFINSHLTLQTRSMVPNAIEIGGIHIKPRKPLPKHLQTFIDEAKHGVILFSFGSVMNTSTLSTEIKLALIQTFASIPQRVIWKFEEKIEGVSDNVFISNWIPQRDILDHKNVIAFISHCGLAGIYEAIYTGTPIVAYPFFCDQRSNAALLVDLQVAVKHDITEMNKENLLNALDQVVNDTRYRSKMYELSKIFKDRPMTPQELVVYWTEYVARHNGALHLMSAAVSMPLYQYLLLDIVAVMVLGCLVLYYASKKLFLLILRNQRKSERSLHKKKF